MEKNEFARLENVCQLRFMEAGTCFHVCSQENHPVLFHNDEEFKAAMNMVALVAILCPDVKIYTFEIMGNHFHFALSGQREQVEIFTRTLILRLVAHPTLYLSSADIKKLSFKFHPIESLENLRNVIAYINRNGSVVNADESVYTYRWGANRFFFNTEAELRFRMCGAKPTYREKRGLFHSDFVNREDRLLILDGYASPLCFCDISKAESFFRDNRHYFFSISRNIEASKDIALSIGEHIFYSDEDLYAHIRATCARKYGCKTVTLLKKEVKVELAKELHFDFNAGNKQISRLLKIELPVIAALFPE